MATTASTKVITGTVRFSYEHVFEPTAMQEGQEPKYNICLLIPKDDEKTIAKINAAIELAIANGMDKVGKNGKVAPGIKMPLRDGDTEREEEAFEGHYFVNASSKLKPQIVDADLNPIMSRDEFYSGCYGRASINFYAFNVSGNRGIACGLNNLQKLEDGESLAGSTSAAADFGDDDLM